MNRNPAVSMLFLPSCSCTLACPCLHTHEFMRTIVRISGFHAVSFRASINGVARRSADNRKVLANVCERGEKEMATGYKQSNCKRVKELHAVSVREDRRVE